MLKDRWATAIIAAPIMLAWASPASANASQFSIVVLENDHVKVTEIFAPAGSILSDISETPAVLVSLNRAIVAVETGREDAVVEHLQEGRIQWRDGRNVRVLRVVAGTAHLFRVEVRSAHDENAPRPTRVATDHSTLVDPDQHHLLFENAHVRVIDGMASAGAASARHSHPPTVLISLKKSRFKVTINGKTRIFDFEPATVRWTNHFEHSWSVLSGDARVVMVEIKSAEMDPAYGRRR